MRLGSNIDRTCTTKQSEVKPKMTDPVQSRTVVSRQFMNADEVDPSELPGKLAILQQYVLDSVERNCRHLATHVSTWRDNELYLHFEPTWEEFVSNRLQQPIEWVDHVIGGLSILDNPQPTRSPEDLRSRLFSVIPPAELIELLRMKLSTALDADDFPAINRITEVIELLRDEAIEPE
jgi:hypothetical protein